MDSGDGQNVSTNPDALPNDMYGNMEQASKFPSLPIGENLTKSDMVDNVMNKIQKSNSYNPALVDTLQRDMSGINLRIMGIDRDSNNSQLYLQINTHHLARTQYDENISQHFNLGDIILAFNSTSAPSYRPAPTGSQSLYSSYDSAKQYHHYQSSTTTPQNPIQIFSPASANLALREDALQPDIRKRRISGMVTATAKSYVSDVIKFLSPVGCLYHMTIPSSQTEKNVNYSNLVQMHVDIKHGAPFATINLTTQGLQSRVIQYNECSLQGECKYLRFKKVKWNNGEAVKFKLENGKKEKQLVNRTGSDIDVFQVQVISSPHLNLQVFDEIMDNFKKLYIPKKEDGRYKNITPALKRTLTPAAPGRPPVLEPSALQKNFEQFYDTCLNQAWFLIGMNNISITGSEKSDVMSKMQTKAKNMCRAVSKKMLSSDDKLYAKLPTEQLPMIPTIQRETAMFVFQCRVF